MNDAEPAQRRSTASPRVVYLGGLGRSGTTLIERLLGELPGICPVGEVVHMWQRGVVHGELCGCGEVFTRCPFWSQVGRIAFGGWGQVDVARIAKLRSAVDRNRFIPLLAAPRLGIAQRRLLSEYLAYYQRIYRGISEVSGSVAIVDSSKHASLAFCLRRCADIDLRVIHVVRDSRAVAYSWTTQVRRPDAATESFMTTYSPAAAALQWNVQNGAMQMLARSATPTIRVRYEDLINAPKMTLRRITAFAGLPSSDVDMAFVGGDRLERWADLGEAHTASGNPMRFMTGRIPIRADQRWRTEMPAGQRRAVTALTLPLLARYGYAGRRAG